MDKIIDNLYLGDIRAAANLFLLKQHVSKDFETMIMMLISCTGCDPYLASASRAEPLLPIRK